MQPPLYRCHGHGREAAKKARVRSNQIELDAPCRAPQGARKDARESPPRLRPLGRTSGEEAPAGRQHRPAARDMGGRCHRAALRHVMPSLCLQWQALRPTLRLLLARLPAIGLQERCHRAVRLAVLSQQRLLLRRLPLQLLLPCLGRKVWQGGRGVAGRAGRRGSLRQLHRGQCAVLSMGPSQRLALQAWRGA